MSLDYIMSNNKQHRIYNGEDYAVEELSTFPLPIQTNVLISFILII